ncbi:hypothetical protein Y900_003450 [Mycolicibacterium aromaticivorans JS19b1 = JCM 16368]|uniref:Uncharacterized protein n=2 Tax=Mycolicibacterium aromaticivorans TaxID=318425 RepID=A0A064CEA9_9MYCO|nr:hypothetical protein Y900_003450 [Mycolicibacterium aromaticivorans JS19b1 = JCM 16368]
MSVAQSTPAKVARAKQGEGNAITVDFMYPPGDPHWTDEAKAALHEAANALVADIVAPKPVTITYKLGTDENPDNLAQASSDRVNLESPGYFRTVVQQKLITGEDANGDEPDGDIDINWKADWALGDSVTPDQADFKAVIMHEMGHTLGFDTNIQGPGSAPVTNHPVFDEFVVDAQGTKVMNDDFTFNTAFEPNLTGGDGGLFFGGPNAMAAYDGKPVPLLTDSPWSVSNIAHLNGHVFTNENRKVMNSGNEATDGPETHVLSPVELGILEDLGYTVVQH